MGDIDVMMRHLVHAFASYIALLSTEQGCDKHSRRSESVIQSCDDSEPTFMDVIERGAKGIRLRRDQSENKSCWNQSRLR